MLTANSPYLPYIDIVNDIKWQHEKVHSNATVDHHKYEEYHHNATKLENDRLHNLSLGEEVGGREGRRSIITMLTSLKMIDCTT